MARTRNLKPGFFRNEVLASFPPMTRLLFAGLWTLADREGRLRDNPKLIRADLFPYEEQLTVAQLIKMLDMLVASNFIFRYEVSGERFIQVTNWGKHQHPHHMEVSSELPPPPDNAPSTRRAQAVDDSCTISEQSVDGKYTNGEQSVDYRVVGGINPSRSLVSCISHARTLVSCSDEASVERAKEPNTNLEEAAAEWPATRCAVESFFPTVDDQFIVGLALACVKENPNVTDEEIAQGVYTKHWSGQSGPGGFMGPVTKYVKAKLKGTEERPKRKPLTTQSADVSESVAAAAAKQRGASNGK